MNDYWTYEYVPEIAQAGIPREQQEAAYSEWQKTKSKRAMGNLLRTFAKLVNSEVGRYQGTLSRPVLSSFAKKYVSDAVKSFDPSTGNQLSTHIVNQMKRLHRLNYTHVQGLKAPESVQAKMNPYFQAKELLKTELGRSPSLDEIADKMSVPLSFVKKLDKGIKLEISPDDEQTSLIDMDNQREKDIADYLYFELPESHKKIFEHKTGYMGSKILPNIALAKKLGISTVRITQISKDIGKKFNKYMGRSR